MRTQSSVTASNSDTLPTSCPGPRIDAAPGLRDSGEG